jgi:mannose-1-phosphate guanylyltransferase
VRTSTNGPANDDSKQIAWTLTLAGGEGTRLADYVERRFGRRIPKQYCRMLGSRSMLQCTLERLNTLNPPSRSLTVIGTGHEELAVPQLRGLSDHVFCQPNSRDTGVALYVALAMIKHWTPNAIVTITPADHYISPSALYVAQVADAQDAAVRIRDQIIILAIKPLVPDPELGYLLVGGAAGSPRTRNVFGFVEKPSVERADDLIAKGALWNTMVTCGSVDALWQLGRDTQPSLINTLDMLALSIGTRYESDAIDSVYRAQQSVSFSRDMLEHARGCLVAYELECIEWSDWGRPDRIEKVLHQRLQRELSDPHVYPARLQANRGEYS